MSAGVRAWTSGLARLAFARALPLPAALLAIAALVLVRWRESARAAELRSLLAPGADGTSASDVATAVRDGLWTLTVVVGVPYAVTRAAATFGRWRAGELDFLAPRAAPRGGIVLATWLGHALAVVAIVAGVAVVTEAGLADRASFVEGARVELPPGGWLKGGEPWRARLVIPQRVEGTRAALDFVLGAGNGPSAEVVVRARTVSAARTTEARDARASPRNDAREARASVGTRGRVEVELPAGGDAIELEVLLPDPASRVLLTSRAAQLWIPSDGARRASLVLAARVVLATLAAGALALGAGAYVSPTIASLLTLALWLVPSLLGASPAWMPGLELFAALDVLARGRVPAAPHVAELVGAVAIVAFSLALPLASPSAWRRTR